MKKILIIDDSDIARCMLAEMFSNAGFEVLEADSGPTGIELYQSQSPDLVTLDITMPKISGIEVLEEIMKINPDAVVIMITAVGQREVVLKCLKTGAKGYITKPYIENEILSTIHKHLPE